MLLIDLELHRKTRLRGVAGALQKLWVQRYGILLALEQIIAIKGKEDL